MQGLETPAEPFPQSWPGVLCGGHLWEDTHQKVRVKTPKEIEDTPKGIYHERIPCHKFSTIPMHKYGYCLGPPILPFFQRMPLQSITLLVLHPPSKTLLALVGKRALPIWLGSAHRELSTWCGGERWMLWMLKLGWSWDPSRAPPHQTQLGWKQWAKRFA